MREDFVVDPGPSPMLYRHGPLPKIPLDLTADGLTTTASGPTHIHARAGDESVDITYRDGHIAIRVQAPDEEPRTLYEGTIGPPSHNDILLSQVHDLFGITVAGQAPGRHLERRADSPLHHIRPLGQAGIYWEQALWITPSAASQYLEALRAEIPGLTALETRWKREPEKPWQMSLGPMGEIATSGSPVILAPGTLGDRIRAIQDETHLTPARIDEALPGNVRLQHRWDSFVLRRDADDRTQRVSQAIGRPITIHECPGAIVTAQVHAADPVAKGHALAVARITDREFGKAIDIVDLATGATERTVTAGRWYSRDIARWCQDGADRYLLATDEGDGRWLGYRPAAAPR
jgi:hypothetical protein